MSDENTSPGGGAGHPIKAWLRASAIARTSRGGERSGSNIRIAPERLVFINETWTKTTMAPLRGWARRGLRLTAKVPHGRGRTTTFLAALRHDRIEAPWVVEGPIDGESFRTYVEKVLVPCLKPDEIVMMDNLGSHKGKVVRQLIRSAGAKRLFLPKYSPNLNRSKTPSPS